ncbi:hypothetical protein C8J57DRAFT_461302 [Mycena rebaudengoi]|nr:hypothetical protein C8J57DRAFT_461302 [Mycena rebaudengoi]
MTTILRDSFIRLSDSALQYLLQFFDDSDLYLFSLTCCRMHHLALASLLSRRGISDPADTVYINLEVEANALQALRLALFVSSIKHLSLRFSPYPPYPTNSAHPTLLSSEQLRSTAQRLFWEMEGCRRLLEKLISVGEMTLIFPGSLEWNLRDVNLECGSTSDMFQWPLVASFLQAAIDKRCVSLNVANSPFYNYARTLPRPGRVPASLFGHVAKKLLHRGQKTDVSVLARWDGKTYRPKKVPLCRDNHLDIRLTTFTLNSSLLLFPPCAGWTFSILSHSPLVSLRLSELHISRPDWHHVADRLAAAVPDLLELSLDDRNISPDCLMRLLNKLQNLTRLSLGSHMDVYLTYPRIFPPFSTWYLPAFHNLAHLTASPAYVSLFLMRKNPLPSLTSLKLPEYDVSRIAADDYDYEAIYVHIPRILRRLREINHSIPPPPLTIMLRGWNFMHRNIDTALALDTKSTDPLREVKYLAVERFKTHTNKRDFARWLKQFPCVRDLSLNGSQDLLNNAYPLLREISRACPNIETITVQGMNYDLTSVLLAANTESGHAAEPAFTDLPSDILLVIFDFLHVELFHLSLLCRRLHYLALPIFLSKYGIFDPCERASVDLRIRVPDREDALTALTVSLFVPSIKHLHCTFPDPKHLHSHLDRIHRVTRLVQKLTMVETISLCFMRNHYKLGHTTQEHQEERLWAACYSALDKLLRTITTKSCTSLSIIGCPAPFSSIDYVPSAPSLCAPSISTLTLDVDASISYSWWILLALRSCPISSMALSVADTTKVDIAYFSSTLRHLSLDGAFTSPARVFNVLSRFQNITTLCLGQNLYEFDDQVVEPVLALTSLTTLTAPLSCISPFVRLCSSFPHLEHVHLLLDALNVGWDLVSAVERVLECGSSVPHFSLDINHMALVAAAIDDSIKSTLWLGAKWRHASRHIDALVVRYHIGWLDSATLGHFDADLRQLFVRWIQSFTVLKDLSLRGCTVAPSESLTALVTSISGAIPSIECIRLNDDVVFQR